MIGTGCESPFIYSHKLSMVGQPELGQEWGPYKKALLHQGLALSGMSVLSVPRTTIFVTKEKQSLQHRNKNRIVLSPKSSQNKENQA